MIFVSCLQCPLRELPVFQPHSAGELALIESLKREQIVVAAGGSIIREGQADGPLFTLLRGWAFRHRTLADGRRQILNFLLPGDFIGMQQRMADGAVHGVTALSEVLLCVFSRDAWPQVHERAPSLAFGVTWLAAREQALIDDDRAMSVGRRGAEERIARLFVLLYRRVADLMPTGGASGVPFPLTEQQVADTLGLTLAHTKTCLRRLEKRGFHSIREGRLYLGDATAVADTANRVEPPPAATRPLI